MLLLIAGGGSPSGFWEHSSSEYKQGTGVFREEEEKFILPPNGMPHFLTPSSCDFSNITLNT